jgi:hypothetical protein
VSTKRLHTTGDLSRHGIPLTVRCTACGHEATLRGMVLDQLCKAGSWDRDLSSVRRRLKCGQRGSRRVEMLPHERMLARARYRPSTEQDAGTELRRAVERVRSIIPVPLP